MHELASDVWLIAQTVDSLELSCTVEQSRRYGDQPSDELEACLGRLAAKCPSWGPTQTQWSVLLDGIDEPVWLLPTSPRKGWRWALETPAWLLLVSGDGQAKPRFCASSSAPTDS